MNSLPATKPLTSAPVWQRLRQHADRIADCHLYDLFDGDPQRFSGLSRSVDGLLLDLSKQRVDGAVLGDLLVLAEQQGLPEWREALFSGAHVNESEGRPAAHWRLRVPREQADAAVNDQLASMFAMVEKISAGHWRGAHGAPIKDVVSIGVGGSELGPLMAHTALQAAADDGMERPKVHFVSALDGSQLTTLLARLDPGETLFLVSSKSFATVDTLSNATVARQWLVSALGDESVVLRCHFIGISAFPDRMTAWGIPEQNQLHLWDWVGGRFSLCSVVGFPVALAIGCAGFEQLLAGAHAMDCHFRSARLGDNLPVLQALVDVWNINCLDIRTRAVLPYDARLRGLPGYLEQLEMESNGKSVARNAEPLDYHTCPVIWGEVGPNAQHAFYQLLHQGTQPVACDLIAVAEGHWAGDGERSDTLAEQHRLSLVSCLAQARLLAFGDRLRSEMEPVQGNHRYRGNQPCTTLVLQRLDPWHLGAMVAMYEHRVFVQSVMWGINPFDQWGVELGKTMVAELQGGSQAAGLDSSTAALLQALSLLGSSD